MSASASPDLKRGLLCIYTRRRAHKFQFLWRPRLATLCTLTFNPPAGDINRKAILFLEKQEQPPSNSNRPLSVSDRGTSTKTPRNASGTKKQHDHRAVICSTHTEDITDNQRYKNENIQTNNHWREICRTSTSAGDCDTFCSRDRLPTAGMPLGAISVRELLATDSGTTLRR